jgi:RimJ/RimL family protein N-acetyltransferase
VNRPITGFSLQPPALLGDKVSLRPVRPGDDRFIFKWLNDAEVMPYWSGLTATVDAAGAAQWVERFLGRERNLAAAIIEVAASPVGFIEISGEPDDANYAHKVEVDICIGEPGQWNRGYGSDALITLLRWFFTSTPVRRVFLQPRLVNERAVHVYKKVGFRREGVLRKGEMIDGELFDAVMMAAIRDDWLPKFAAGRVLKA